MIIDKEVAKQLNLLDAVDHVSDDGTRIEYSDEFRASFVKQYMDGGSPVAIFRQAGLDPKLIGYKRIERATARWIEPENRHHRA